jgi:hypothetical protein
MFMDRVETLIDHLQSEVGEGLQRAMWLLGAVYTSDAAKQELNEAAGATLQYIEECEKAIAALHKSKMALK